MQHSIFSLLALLALAIAPFNDSAMADGVPFGASYSQKVFRDTFINKLFGSENSLFKNLQGKVINVPGQAILLNIDAPQPGIVRINNYTSLNYVLGEKSKSGFLGLYGGSGHATLYDLHIYVPFDATTMNVEFVTYNGLPALQVFINIPDFQVNQYGEVEIEKQVLGISKTEKSSFRGVFDGFQWTGIFLLENKSNLNLITTRLVSSIAAISSRWFDGTGIPSDTFLAEYGDGITNGFKNAIDQLFVNPPSISNGEGLEKIAGINIRTTFDKLAVERESKNHVEVGQLAVTRKLAMTLADTSNVDDCAKNLVFDDPENGIPESSLSSREKGSFVLSAVPFSFFERALYLKARQGDLCVTQSDGSGGTIAFSPTGAFSMKKIDESQVKILITYNYVHKHPPMAPINGSVEIVRKLKLQATAGADGLTSKVQLDSSSDTVTGAATYANAMKNYLSSNPLHLRVPMPEGFGPFNPVFSSSGVSGQFLNLEYAMKGNAGTKTFPLDLEKLFYKPVHNYIQIHGGTNRYGLQTVRQ
jgi:hypothetical protein